MTIDSLIKKYSNENIATNKEVANIILDIARALPKSAYFGDNKVFISYVWKAFHSLPDWREISHNDFKNKLIELHRERLLTLGTADLRGAMNEKDVDESEIKYRQSLFHFVRV